MGFPNGQAPMLQRLPKLIFYHQMETLVKIQSLDNYFSNKLQQVKN